MTTVEQYAPQILSAVRAAKHILLHCHPSADPDSVGSALAMYHALRSLGIQVTVIRGDTPIPEAFSAMPGYSDIVPQSFLETNLADFDCMIALDSSTPGMISRKFDGIFPPHLTVIMIDHHELVRGYGSINWVDQSYPATAQMVYDLLVSWGVPLTQEIALNIFMGMYTDTGGFKYPSTTAATFRAAAHCAEIAPMFPSAVAHLENSETLESLIFQGLALSNIKADVDGMFGFASISQEAIRSFRISPDDASASYISGVLRKVKGFKITAGLVEEEGGTVKVSFRSKDGAQYDVAKIAQSLGGGGHRAASGALLTMTLVEAEKVVIGKVQEVVRASK